MRIDRRYQGHTNALTKYGLATKIFLTLEEIWKKVDASKLNNGATQEYISGVEGRNTYFCAGFYNIWQERIHITIKSFVTLREYLVLY